MPGAGVPGIINLLFTKGGRHMGLKFQHGLAAIIAACAMQAHAATSTYEVVVNWTNGQLAGTSSTATFAFDAALAVPNATYTQPDRLTAFQFDLRGQTYTLADVDTGWLSFDGAGALSGFGIGTDCKPGVCYAYSGNAGSFSITYAAQFLLGSVGDPQALTSWGSGTVAPASAVPEPASWGLMLAGFALVGLAARRKSGPTCSTSGA